MFALSLLFGTLKFTPHANLCLKLCSSKAECSNDFATSAAQRCERVVNSKNFGKSNVSVRERGREREREREREKEREREREGERERERDGRLNEI
jgi:hypothetical protein